MVKLDRNIQDAMTYQEYSSQPAINGAAIYPLKKHVFLEGGFMEYLRLNNGKIEGIDMVPQQISISWVVPNRINAFHLHPKAVQNEIWCVIQGIMQVWLVDVREESSTKGVKSKYILSGENPKMLYVPTGVAHGYKAGTDGAILLYSMDSQFNINNPNEGRLPWDYFGADLWEQDRG